jgi:acyl carrier protein
MTEETTRSTIRTVVSDLGRPGGRFDDDDDLFASGVLRSLSLLELVNRLEDQFGLRVGQTDIVAGRLRSVATIAALVATRAGRAR